MQSVTDVGTLIVHTPGIGGGRPRIADTRVSVQGIAVWYKVGLNAEEKDSCKTDRFSQPMNCPIVIEASSLTAVNYRKF